MLDRIIICLRNAAIGVGLLVVLLAVSYPVVGQDGAHTHDTTHDHDGAYAPAEHTHPAPDLSALAARVTALEALHTTECNDGNDNDQDGTVDWDGGGVAEPDPGCADAADNDEADDAPPAPACDDGLDNDGDQLVDLADPGCTDAADDDETDGLPPPPEDPPVVGEVYFERAFRSQTECDAAMWSSSRRIQPPPDGQFHEAWVQYDPVLDGCKLPIVSGHPMGQLRDGAREEAPLTGTLVVEFDLYMPSGLYALTEPQFGSTSMKIFRVFNEAKRETTRDKNVTVNWVWWKDQVWLRDVGGDQKTGWKPPLDEWVTLRIIIDQDANTLQLVTSDGFTSEIYAIENDLPPVDKAAPLLHSTSRSHSDLSTLEPHAPTFLGYRDVRVYTPAP